MTRDMQDNLERFVDDNKEQFDTLTPKDSLWDGVHAKLDASKHSKTKIIFWRAAAIILFIFSVGLTFFVNRESITNNNLSSVYDDEFLTTEKYYISVIQEREQLVALVANTYPEIKDDFEKDWKMLDESYARLKTEYKKNQSSEVLNALVQNLRSRVRLLNRQIEVLETIDSERAIVLEI